MFRGFTLLSPFYHSSPALIGLLASVDVKQQNLTVSSSRKHPCRQFHRVPRWALRPASSCRYKFLFWPPCGTVWTSGHTHTHTHSHTHSQRHMHTHTFTQRRTGARTHTHSHRCTLAHTYTHIHTETRACTHTHTHTYVHLHKFSLLTCFKQWNFHAPSVSLFLCVDYYYSTSTAATKTSPHRTAIDRTISSNIGSLPVERVPGGKPHTHTFTDARTHTHTHRLRRTHTHSQTETHTHTHTHTHTYTHTLNTHTHTFTQRCTRACAHTHTHMYTYINYFSLLTCFK